MSTLEPIEPSQALAMYLEDVSGELSPNSVRQKRYQLGTFVEWCDGADASSPRVENLNEISGRDFTRFKNWRDDGISKVTLRTNLSALRTFMRFCVKIDAVGPEIPQKVTVPDLDHGDNTRESLLDPATAETILAFLSKFHYASLSHVLVRLQWRCGVRMSALHSLDVDDVDLEAQRITVRHRPEDPEEQAQPLTVGDDTDTTDSPRRGTEQSNSHDHERKIGTRLKNGYDGERTLAVTEETVEILADYLEHKHTSVIDEYGREPLFSSARGRMSKGHLNKHIYKWTTPCAYGEPCPDGRESDGCEHTGSFSAFVSCPYNRRPHDIRRGSITHWLRQDVPETVVSDRMNVSQKTIERHYDQRSEEEQTEQRREFLDDV